jgi:hypothetical protein
MVVIISTWANRAHSQCVFRPGVPYIESFSSLATVGGLPHPSGIELILRENGSRVEAVLRDYAGEPEPREIKLTGTIAERKTGQTTFCEVDLAGTNKNGALRIHGAITSPDFFGTIQRRIGHDSYSEKVSLRRRVPPDALDTGTL